MRWAAGAEIDIPSKLGSRTKLAKASFGFDPGAPIGLGFRIIWSRRNRNRAMQAAASSRMGFRNAMFVFRT